MMYGIHLSNSHHNQVYDNVIQETNVNITFEKAMFQLESIIEGLPEYDDLVKSLNELKEGLKPKDSNNKKLVGKFLEKHGSWVASTVDVLLTLYGLLK